MATITENPQPTTIRPAPPKRRAGNLQVSAYDQVSGMLIACLTICSFIGLVMFAAWYSTRLWIPKPAVPVMVLEDVGGGGRGSGEGERYVEEEFEEPAATEMQDPTATTSRVEDALDAISLAVSQPEVMAELTLGEKSSSWGNGEGRGQGDGKGDGFGPGTAKGVPAWERWEVRLNAATPEEYAKQLDFFKIELAAAGGGSPVVTYVTNLSAPKPSVRTGNPKDEKRLRFMHRSGVLKDADRKLMAKAGVDTSNKVIFQFYSQETYTALLTLENIAMKPRSISDVRRTVFGVKELPGGRYEFYVISQEYR
jgi:hypothetical protein